jgi:cysteine-rich repeat protein
MLRRTRIASAALLAAAVSACGNGDGDGGGDEAVWKVPQPTLSPADHNQDRPEAPYGSRDIALAGSEVEPNDAPATASGPIASGTLVAAAIIPANDLDYFSFTVAATSDVIIETFDGNGPSTCAAGIDTVIQLLAPNGTTLLVSDDDGGPGSCSLIHPTNHTSARQLAPGTYFTRVNDFGSNSVIAAYTLRITLPVCGDGLIQGRETCDDQNTTPGDGCDAACQQEPICGDGLITPPEQCDDGNTAPGDGCSATCSWEVGEVEPNNGGATASGPVASGVVTHAAITPIGDQDYFSFTLAATSDVIIETFDGNGPSTCVAGVDTVIQLLAPDGTTILANDDESGPGSCSRIHPTNQTGARQLAAGTYFARVQDFGNNSVIASYTVRITVPVCGDGVQEGRETCDDQNTTPGDGCDAACQREALCGDGFIVPPEECDDSNTAPGDGCSATCSWEVKESEPNDSAVTASGPFPPGAVVHAAVSPIGDQDFLSFVVPATSDVRIETFDELGPSSCTFGNHDTVIDLFATDGTTILATDDEDGPGNCSRIDPTTDFGARQLAAGTYYVRTHDFGNNSVIAGYTVRVTFTATCGDGVVQGSETCDDANVVSGDCCSAACQLEAGCEVEPNDSPATASGPYPTDSTIKAAIDPMGDQDYFVFDVAATSDVVIETFDGTGPSSCASGVDTLVELLGTDGSTVLATDDDDGPLSCSRIDPIADPSAQRLAPGTYFVHVNDFKNDEPIDAYTLRISFTAICGDGSVSGSEECDDGNVADGDGCDHECTIQPILEVEPNNDAATANGPFATNAPRVGAIDPSGDNDWFAVTVPGPASKLTVTVAAGTTATCGPAGAIDSEIGIYGSNGTTLLAFNDDENRDLWCSRAFAAGLAAGTYFVRTAASTTYCPSCTYDYSLVVDVQ